MESPYKIFNPLMDPENNDLEKVVERYNKMISFPDNKKLEWEDDDYIEENVGWEKIESAEQLKKHIIDLFSEERDYLFHSSVPEETEEFKNITDNDFLSEIMKMCDGYCGEPTLIFDKQTSTARSVPNYYDEDVVGFYTTDDILDYLREKCKTHYIIFYYIQILRDNSKSKFKLRIHSIER